ncbi:hypothetical protein D9757_013149 [Collybiopsis confluens]|uniref:Glycosyltransferase 2-like domain-containing protein n=1 Tax=Collybiopsis confluens TaxID=2823264 RepID=A0A8H5GSI9_9AGAR|nr:hypothetical protein D9757_014468 [Collybiopsis confluens]KAF5370414.1 hypothetical protein D9757_013149 [Collybiopsis confluens]
MRVSLIISSRMGLHILRGELTNVSRTDVRMEKSRLLLDITHSLRWKAVQNASFIDPADGKREFWSEASVSEDFDLALRLLLKGYTLRWATGVLV